MVKVKFKIVRSGQGGRIPAKYKVCADCGTELVKHRYEIITGPPLFFDRKRVCPMCVLLGYLNNERTWWQKLYGRYKINDVNLIKVKEVTHRSENGIP